jgi:hypothetical protein
MHVLRWRNIVILMFWQYKSETSTLLIGYQSPSLYTILSQFNPPPFFTICPILILFFFSNFQVGVFQQVLLPNFCIYFLFSHPSYIFGLLYLAVLTILVSYVNYEAPLYVLFSNPQSSLLRYIQILVINACSLRRDHISQQYKHTSLLLQKYTHMSFTIAGELQMT